MTTPPKRRSSEVPGNMDPDLKRRKFSEGEDKTQKASEPSFQKPPEDISLKSMEEHKISKGAPIRESCEKMVGDFIRYFRNNLEKYFGLFQQEDKLYTEMDGLENADEAYTKLENGLVDLKNELHELKMQNQPSNEEIQKKMNEKKIEIQNKKAMIKEHSEHRSGELNIAIEEIERKISEIESRSEEVKKSTMDGIEKTFELLYSILRENDVKEQSLLQTDFLKAIHALFDIPELLLDEDLMEYRMSQLKNKITNTIVYLSKTQQILESKKEEVVKEFELGITSEKLDAHIKKILNGDRHEPGQQPVLVEFRKKDSDEVIKEVVYKPRRGTIDRAIMDLFNNINRIKKDEEPLLPVYKILDFKEEGSIHEFIDGKHPERLSAAEEIEKIPQSFDKENFRKQLVRLESICRSMGLTDLHNENIMFTSDGKIFLIDLEAINPSKETGLFGYKEGAPKFEISNGKEMELIVEFNTACETIPHRFVPMATDVFAEEISDPKGYEKIVPVLSEALVNKGYEKPDENILKNLLKTNFCNEDIPYFTKKGDELYYGSQVEDVLVKIREKEGEK